MKQILLVEDNEGDILLTTDILKDADHKIDVVVARDGVEAIEYLSISSENINNILPDLILLDINLPRKNGFEVLAHIKNSETLKAIPVIVLTTSSSERDKKMAFDHQSDDFITKPSDLGEFIDLLSFIKLKWLNIA